MRLKENLYIFGIYGYYRENNAIFYQDNKNEQFSVKRDSTHKVEKHWQLDEHF